MKNPINETNFKDAGVIEHGSEKTVLPGQLEIDHRRGVIYFHCYPSAITIGYPATKLRIQGLKDLNVERGFMIDCRADLIEDEKEACNHRRAAKMFGICAECLREPKADRFEFNQGG